MTSFPPQQPEPAHQMRPVVFKLKGMSFLDSYPGNVLRLNGALLEHHAEWGIGFAKRNPANQYDPNAVEIHSTEVGMLGHVPRELAAMLAPLMDDGKQYDVAVRPRIDPDHPQNPGVDVRMVRI